MCLALIGSLAAPQESRAVLITIDTSALAAGTGARLDFSFFDGDFSLGNNTVTIDNITTDGTLQGTDCTVGCSGGPPYVLDESFSFGQFLQDLLLGTTISFDLTFTTNFSGTGDPDALVLMLLDPNTNFTLVDTDLDANPAPIPYQDALLILALQGNGQITVATVGAPVTVGAVPEPATLALLALTLGLLAVTRRRAWAARSI